MALTYLLWVRLASVLAVAALKTSLPWVLYESAFYAVLFSHYLLAVVYAQGRAAALLRRPSGALAAALLIGLASLQIRAWAPPLLFYFSIHHAFNDTYTMHREMPTLDAPAAAALPPARVALNLAAYFFLFKTVFPVSLIPGLALDRFLLASAAAFLVALWRAAPALTGGQLVNLLLFESIGVAAAAWGSSRQPRFEDVVLYHLIYWILIPLRTTVQRQAGRPDYVPRVGRYLAAITGTTCGFYLFTPYHHLVGGVSLAQWIFWSQAWGYVHVTSSFALSRLNPRWVNRLFSPA